MPETTKIPAATHITLTLTVKDAARAIDFYKKAFGAEELTRMASPDGQSIMHAELKFGDTVIFLNDEVPGTPIRSPQTLGGATGSMYFSVPDVDPVFKKALDAGAKQEMAVEDMFWGDRMGSVVDPFGHHWSIGTHKEDLSPEEMNKRAKTFFDEWAKRHPGEGTV